jgi:hypothetical protein
MGIFLKFKKRPPPPERSCRGCPSIGEELVSCRMGRRSPERRLPERRSPERRWLGSILAREEVVGE